MGFKMQKKNYKTSQVQTVVPLAHTFEIDRLDPKKAHIKKKWVNYLMREIESEN